MVEPLRGSHGPEVSPGSVIRHPLLPEYTPMNLLIHPLASLSFPTFLYVSLVLRILTDWLQPSHLLEYPKVIPSSSFATWSRGFQTPTATRYQTTRWRPTEKNRICSTDLPIRIVNSISANRREYTCTVPS